MTEWTFVETWSVSNGTEAPAKWFREEIVQKCMDHLAKKGLDRLAVPTFINNRMIVRTSQFGEFKKVIQSIETTGRFGTTRAYR